MLIVSFKADFIAVISRKPAIVTAAIMSADMLTIMSIFRFHYNLHTAKIFNLEVTVYTTPMPNHSVECNLYK